MGFLDEQWTFPDGPVVVGVDASAGAERAIQWAAEVALGRRRALEVVHAWTKPWAGDLPDLVTMQPVPYEEFAADVLRRAVERARALVGDDVEVRDELVAAHAPEALLARAQHAALLVLGSHGREWMGSVLRGSVSQQCATHASSSVALVPTSWRGAWSDRVLVGVDGSDAARRAAELAASEAVRRGALLDVVHVVDHRTGWLRAAGPEESRRWSDEIDDPVLAPTVAAVVGAHPSLDVRAVTAIGHPARTLLARADDVDLLVVGPRGDGGFANLLLGSVCTAALHQASCPLIIAR